MYPRRFTLILLLLWAWPAFAAEHESLHLDASRLAGKIDLLPHMQILVDPDGQFAIDEVAGADMELQFVAGNITGNNFGINKGVFWVRFTLEMEESFAESVILHLDYPLVDEISLFLPDGQGGFIQKSAGEIYSFSQREISYRSYLFELPAHPGKMRTYYIRLWNEGSLQIPLSLWTTKTLIENIDRVNFALGVYYGIMALLMLSSLAFFFKFQERLFLTYSFLPLQLPAVSIISQRIQFSVFLATIRLVCLTRQLRICWPGNNQRFVVFRKLSSDLGTTISATAFGLYLSDDCGCCRYSFELLRRLWHGCTSIIYRRRIAAAVGHSCCCSCLAPGV